MRANQQQQCCCTWLKGWVWHKRRGRGYLCRRHRAASVLSGCVVCAMIVSFTNSPVNLWPSEVLGGCRDVHRDYGMGYACPGAGYASLPLSCLPCLLSSVSHLAVEPRPHGAPRCLFWRSPRRLNGVLGVGGALAFCYTLTPRSGTSYLVELVQIRW